mmetsp:Transcript_91315/g.152968  ORF Transcript_91315/g.152968 Transcript_91315/m.152968 type:complete len:101 (-) Transcript_91315:392-694(-)
MELELVHFLALSLKCLAGCYTTYKNFFSTFSQLIMKVHELWICPLCPVYQGSSVSYALVAQFPRTIWRIREHFKSAPQKNHLLDEGLANNVPMAMQTAPL